MGSKCDVAAIVVRECNQLIWEMGKVFWLGENICMGTGFNEDGVVFSVCTNFESHEPIRGVDCTSGREIEKKLYYFASKMIFCGENEEILMKYEVQRVYSGLCVLNE